MGTATVTVHELKTWPVYFQEIADGNKTFEYRLDDRGFKTGDQVRLREYSVSNAQTLGGCYTGRELTATIGYILRLTMPRVVFSLLDVRDPSKCNCSGVDHRTNCPDWSLPL